MARRRRSCEPVLSAGERLESRLALAVDVTLSGSTLSLVYGAVGDAATLAVDDDLNYTVTGDSGTVVTGSAATGSFDSVFSVVVVNESVGGGQSFTFSGADFVQVLAGLSVGSATAGISQVTITAPEDFGTNGPVAIYADDVTIATTVYGPGQSLVIVATGTVSIDTIDEFEGSIAISCDSLSMSGSLLNDGFFTSGPASDSFAAGDAATAKAAADWCGGAVDAFVNMRGAQRLLAGGVSPTATSLWTKAIFATLSLAAGRTDAATFVVREVPIDLVALARASGEAGPGIAPREWLDIAAACAALVVIGRRVGVDLRDYRGRSGEGIGAVWSQVNSLPVDTDQRASAVGRGWIAAVEPVLAGSPAGGGMEFVMANPLGIPPLWPALAPRGL